MIAAVHLCRRFSVVHVRSRRVIALPDSLEFGRGWERLRNGKGGKTPTPLETGGNVLVHVLGRCRRERRWTVGEPPRGHSSGHRWTSVRLPSGCRNARWKAHSSSNSQNTMRTSIDYTKLAASLDYAALERKLDQLSERQPPKTRKSVADVLDPVRERLLALHRGGWTSLQLAQELKNAGVPVSPARLRECLNTWSGDGGPPTKRPVRRRPVIAPSDPALSTTAPASPPVRKPVIPPPQSPFTLR